MTKSEQAEASEVKRDQELRVVVKSHGRGKVYLNGEQLQGVTSISLSIGVGSLNEATITMLPNRIEVEGVHDVNTIEADAKPLCSCSPAAIAAALAEEDGQL